MGSYSFQNMCLTHAENSATVSHHLYCSVLGSIEKYPNKEAIAVQLAVHYMQQSSLENGRIFS